MSGNQKTMIRDFTQGNVTKQLLVFALPLFLSSLLQIVYNMVDMIIVGQALGKVGLSAVAVGGDVSQFMTFMAMGFSNAGQVLIAQYIGAGRKDHVGQFISTMATFLLGSALVLSVLCLSFRVPILTLMNTPEEAFSEAMAYSTVCMVGLVFIYGYNICSAVLRGMGDSKHPFVFISIAAVLNVVLDLLFVMGFHMGSMGAALATVISQGVSFIACGVFMYRNRERLGFEIKASDFLHINTEMLASLIKLGVPMAIKSVAIMVSKLFVSAWINSFGVAVSAVAGIASKLTSIGNLISQSLNTSCSSMVGQNIGAGKFHRVPRIVLTVGAATLSISAVLSLIVGFFPEFVYGIFTDDPAVMAVALEHMPICIIMFMGCACRAPLNALINGSGNYKINFVTAIMDGIVLRIGLSVLFGIALDMGYVGFWLGDALAGFTPMVIGLVFYISGKWKKQAVKAA